MCDSANVFGCQCLAVQDYNCHSHTTSLHVPCRLLVRLALTCVCQIVSVKEIRRILSNAEVQRLPLPELRSCSKILENHHIRQVEKTSCCVSHHHRVQLVSINVTHLSTFRSWPYVCWSKAVLHTTTVLSTFFSKTGDSIGYQMN